MLSNSAASDQDDSGGSGITPLSDVLMGSGLGPVSSFLESSQDLVLLVDPSGTIIFANRSWRQALGYPLEELQGLSIFDVVPWQERAHCQAWLQNAAQLNPRPRFPLCFVSKAGRQVAVEGAALARVRTGTVLLQAVFRDVSEKRQAEAALRANEERFRLLSTHAPVGVFEADADGRLTYTNARWRQMAGLTEPCDPRGVWWQAVHPEDRERVIREWRSAFRLGHEFLAEFRLRSTGEQTRWGRTRLVQVHDAEGPTTCIGITEDISDLKLVERELAAARDAALETAKLKSQFLANVSHEVRTPLNGVIGLLDLLIDTPLANEQRQFAETARDSANQLLSVLNDVLDLSRVEAGKLSLEQVVFSLRQLVEGCVKLFAPKAQQKGVRLKALVDARVPDRVLGDPSRLRQVLGNLVGNAVKFTEQGSIELEVHPLGTSSSAVKLRFQVRDSGIGIPLDALESVFQPFVQVDGSALRRFGGTGLGLAICRQLVEMMGGEIGVESQPQIGSVFWFTLSLSTPVEPPPVISPS